MNIVLVFFISYKMIKRYREDDFRLDEITESSYWKDKVSLYHMLNSEQGGNIFFVGDSMIDRFCLTEFFSGRNVYNRGIGWDHTGSLLLRLDQTVLQGKPSEIFLYIGGNDISQNVADSVIFENFNKIAQKIVENRIELTVISVLPRGTEYQPQYMNLIEFNRSIRLFNEKLKDLCKSKGIGYLDIQSEFTDPKGILRTKLTNDGTHLNGMGYAIFAREISFLLL